MQLICDASRCGSDMLGSRSIGSGINIPSPWAQARDHNTTPTTTMPMPQCSLIFTAPLLSCVPAL
jgi:hypothetical protein